LICFSFALIRLPVCPADVCETQKVERFGLAFPSSFPWQFGIPPELDPARFVGMEFQRRFPRPFPVVLQKTVRFGPVLERNKMMQICPRASFVSGTRSPRSRRHHSRSAAVRPGAEGAPPRRRPNIRPPGPLPRTPATCREHTAGQVSAGRPSAGCRSASRTAPSAPARSGRNSPATNPLAVVGREPSNLFK